MGSAHGGIEKRSKQIALILKHKKIDLVCLQEVGQESLDIITNLTNLTVASWDKGEEGNAVLVNNKVKLLKHGVYDLTTESPQKKVAWSEIQSESGRRWHIQSAHLSWGAIHEGTRLQQAYQLNAKALTSGSDIKIIGMDANTTSKHQAMRYLLGYDVDPNNESTMWVDTVSALQKQRICTSCPKNPHAKNTAKMVGILDPTHIPHRQIDYLLIAGYAYGKPGFALQSKIIGNKKKIPSDHYGIYAKLWDPLQN